MDRHDVVLLNDPVILRELRETLKKGNSFNFVFHGIEKEFVEQAAIAEALVEAKKDFISNCPKIVELKREFPTRVHIYWIPIRLHDHCMVIGDQVVLREKAHSQDEYPKSIVFKDEKLIKAWEEYIERIISFDWVKEIDFEEALSVVEAAT